MRFVLCSGNNWWRTHHAQTLRDPNFSITIREIGIREGGSSKSFLIIISSSRNVKRQSSLSNSQIVLTDLSVTHFRRPVHNSLCTSRSPSQNFRHHFLTICTFMMSPPYTSVSCLRISTTLVFYAVKNCITARGIHGDKHAICSSMFVVRLSSFIQAERPTKISVLSQS